MFKRGVNATSIDDILLATGTSKSQLYSHFGDRERLIRAVVRHRGEVVLEREHGRPTRIPDRRADGSALR